MRVECGRQANPQESGGVAARQDQLKIPLSIRERQIVLNNSTLGGVWVEEHEQGNKYRISIDNSLAFKNDIFISIPLDSNFVLINHIRRVNQA